MPIAIRHDAFCPSSFAEIRPPRRVFAAPPRKNTAGSVPTKAGRKLLRVQEVRTDTAHRYALRRAVPECGHVGDLVRERRPVRISAIYGWERVGLSNQPL